MAVESTVKPNGLKTAWDTIVAPKAAFESLSIAPTWGWALLIVLVIATFSSYLTTPAVIHAITSDWPNMVAKNPQLAAQSAEQQQAGLAIAVRFAGFGWVFTPIAMFIVTLIGAVVLLIFNAIGRGSGSFAKFWAAQWNIAMVGALAALVTAIIVLARGADTFTSAAQVQSAVPSLGMLVPDTSVKLHAFLSVFTPFGIWTAGLEIAALRIIGRVGTVPAWLGGSLTLILGGLLAAAFAR